MNFEVGLGYVVLVAILPQKPFKKVGTEPVLQFHVL